MKKKLKSVSAALMVLLVGCAGGAAHREGPQSPAYGIEKYLTAEGTGASENEAGQEALAALAAIFHTRVRAETRSRTDSYVTAGQGEQFEKQVNHQIQIDTDVQLEGARIGWVRPDESAGGFRALAVLDRQQAAGRWRSQLYRVQTAIDAGMQSLESVKGRLPRLIVLNRLAVLTGEMALMVSRLSVLGRPAMPFDRDMAAMFAERERLIRSAALFIHIEGEAAELFAHRLETLITGQGYLIAKTGEAAAGLISGRVWIQPLYLDNENANFVRALADISVIDLDSDRALAAFSENSRKGHLDENEAQRRAIDDLAGKTAAKITRSLGNMGLDD